MHDVDKLGLQLHSVQIIIIIIGGIDGIADPHASAESHRALTPQKNAAAAAVDAQRETILS